MALFFIVFFLLRSKRDEAITLSLILSASSCVSLFFDMVRPVASVAEVIAKLFLFLLFMFFAYQLHFFRRADVRYIFDDKGFLVY